MTDNPMLPKGAQSVVLVGDPTKAGVFILRVKFPAHYRVPPHTHPVSEVVIIITGNLGSGWGEKFDAHQGEILKAGSLFVLPAKHAHYVWTIGEETIVQVQASGPWGINYLNPADDPRKKPN
jgi:quercetin dioxygenase-like cupin family protein